MIPATSKPTRERDADTYQCRWCGIERLRSGNRSRRVCRDCERTDIAFGGK